MSSRGNIASKTVVVGNTKNTVGDDKHTLVASKTSPKGLVVYENCSTLIEVTVKNKGQKRSSAMVSSSPSNQKIMKEKRRSVSSGDFRNWTEILRGNCAQQLTKIQSLKPAKYGSDFADIKKQLHQKSKNSQKHLHEMDPKSISSRKKVEEQVKVAQCTISVPNISSMETIEVHDRGVQCGGIFECPNDKFGVFNPVRTLGFLMKELEALVKNDDKASKILTDMEQILFRIPTEYPPVKPTVTYSLEAIALRRKLEESTMKLEEASKQMNKKCETLREERDSFQRQVQKQESLVKKERERRNDFELAVKKTKQELEEAMKVVEIREKTIADLKQEIKEYEFSTKVIADLRASLNEQTELAGQRHLEIQYLTLEKDKLHVLSTYKESLLIGLRNAVWELQHHIADQLINLKDAYIHDENSNPQMSLARAGIAFSSPTSTSHESIGSNSWQNISDVTLSAVEHHACSDKIEEGIMQATDKEAAVSILENTIENFEKKRTKESKVRDSGQLEFVSLPAGESSHALLLPSSKDLGCTESSQLVTKERDDTKEDDNVRQLKDVEFNVIKEKTSAEKMNDKMKSLPKDQQSSKPSKKQSFEKKPMMSNEDLKNNLSGAQIDSSISQQFQHMFEGIRFLSRMPVSLPSPPRNYPQPDLSDSTLVSISTASELAAMRSNVNYK